MLGACAFDSVYIVNQHQLVDADWSLFFFGKCLFQKRKSHDSSPPFLSFFHKFWRLYVFGTLCRHHWAKFTNEVFISTCWPQIHPHSTNHNRNRGSFASGLWRQGSVEKQMNWFISFLFSHSLILFCFQRILQIASVGILLLYLGAI